MKVRLKPAIPLIVWALAVVVPAAQAATTDVTDEEISRATESEFWVDNAVDANEIDVTTSDGIVTLKGTVDNILAKERAERIVESVVGVRAIVNMIEVVPPLDKTDAEVKRDVKDALFADPATESYEVDVDAIGGVVGLTGTVDSWQEKQLCAQVAKGVSGVRGIRNDLRVDYKVDRPDFEIKQEVKARLMNDIRVDDYLVDVSASDGKIVLTGTVGSLSEKRRAVNDAWVAGVKAVDADGLEIAWFVRDRLRRKSAYVDRTDQEIEEAVKDAFLYDPRVLSFKPNVSVEAGTVTLTGVVDNYKAKAAAEEDARHTLGVWRVRNHIKVRPESTPKDEVLESRVKQALLSDVYVDRFDLDVEAYSGWVYLSGEVNSSFEKDRAKQVAEGVKGVVGVVDNVDAKYEWEWKTDMELKQDVEDQLFWSPFVDRDEVHVEVDYGTVTLTGTVETLSERQAAETNAWQAGARKVVNNLAVTYQQYGPSYPYWNRPYPILP